MATNAGTTVTTRLLALCRRRRLRVRAHTSSFTCSAIDSYSKWFSRVALLRASE